MFSFVFVLIPYFIKIGISQVPYGDTFQIINDSCTQNINVSCGCNGDYIMISIHKLYDSDESISHINGYECAKPPNGYIGTNDCYDMSIQFDRPNIAKCEYGYFVQSFYKNDDENLSSIQSLKCCKFSMNSTQEYCINDEYNSTWGNNCLYEDFHGWCTIDNKINNAYITGFRRTNESSEHGIIDLSEVYYRNIILCTTNNITNVTDSSSETKPDTTYTHNSTNSTNSTTTGSLFPTNVIGLSPTNIITIRIFHAKVTIIALIIIIVSVFIVCTAVVLSVLICYCYHKKHANMDIKLSKTIEPQLEHSKSSENNNNDVSIKRDAPVLDDEIKHVNINGNNNNNNIDFENEYENDLDIPKSNNQPNIDTNINYHDIKNMESIKSQQIEGRARMKKVDTRTKRV